VFEILTGKLNYHGASIVSRPFSLRSNLRNCLRSFVDADYSAAVVVAHRSLAVGFQQSTRTFYLVG
jgi:hypothetical protein